MLLGRSLMHKCPECGTVDDRVVDSRVSDDGRRFRRRECLDCGARWNTWEVTQEEMGELCRVQVFEKLPKPGEAS